ncbi:hypothetical protein JCM17823_07340 [Halorubrum gandharaense]
MTQDFEGETIDLDRPADAGVGATRGEISVEVGPPDDRPNHAELTVREPDAGDGAGGDDGADDGVVLSVDVVAGDHGTGHADVTLSPSDVRRLRAALDRVSEAGVE